MSGARHRLENRRPSGGVFCTAIDRVGQKYGRLTVVERSGTSSSGQATWRCVCECGNKSVVRSSELRSGKTRSCGCLRYEESCRHLKEFREYAHYVHGHCPASGPSQTYKSYQDAKGRCTNPRNKAYKNYGARGIQFKFTSFDHFLQEMGIAPPRTTLERCDNDGHYEPGNCRWANATEQANNKRNNRRLTAFGRTRTLARWATELNISYYVVARRLALGWTIDDALTKPVRTLRRNRRLTAFGRTHTLSEWAKEFGIKYATLWGRLNDDQSIEDALTTALRPWHRRTP